MSLSKFCQVSRDFAVATTLLIACFVTSQSAKAQNADFSVFVVPGNAEPWSTAVNPDDKFGINDGGAPVITEIPSGQTSVTVTYQTGTVSADPGVWPFVDANGDLAGPVKGTPGSTGSGFPSAFMATTPTAYLTELVGTFATASGVIVGKPFVVGNEATIDVPAGATQLQLGTNDDRFGDNAGSFTVSVNVPPCSGANGLVSFNDPDPNLADQPSGGPYMAVAGQAIDVSLSLEGSFSPFGQWHAGGSVVAWKPTPSSSVAPNMPGTGDLSGSTAQFFYMQAGTYTIEHDYDDPAGNVCHASADFTVTAPQVQEVKCPDQAGIAIFTGQLTSAEETRSDNVLACGAHMQPVDNITDAQGNIVGTKNAIVFTLYNPAEIAGAQNGGFQWVQVIDTLDRGALSSTGGLTENGASDVLDEVCPYTYAADDKYVSFSNTVSDSPSNVLNNSDVAQALYLKATMYLLWKSNLPGAMSVPLGSAQWLCDAIAIKAPETDNKWVQGFAVSTSSFSASTSYPLWSALEFISAPGKTPPKQCGF